MSKFTPTVEITEEEEDDCVFGGAVFGIPKSVVVTIYYNESGASSVHGGGWSFNNTSCNHKLCARFKRAIEAGAIFSNHRIAKSTSGTYVETDGFIMGKYMNSDLKKLGY